MINIYHASQTGTSTTFADLFSRHFKATTIEYTVQDAGLFDPMKEQEGDHLNVFFIATYGDGEPTDTFSSLFNAVMQGEKEGIEAMPYSIFGLGNKTYLKFNEAAIKWDTALQRQKAIRIGEMGLGDDNADIESDFHAWTDAILPVIHEHLGVKYEKVEGEFQTNYSFEEVDTEKVFTGEIGSIGAREIE